MLGVKRSKPRKKLKLIAIERIRQQIKSSRKMHTIHSRLRSHGGTLCESTFFDAINIHEFEEVEHVIDKIRTHTQSYVLQHLHQRKIENKSTIF